MMGRQKTVVDIGTPEAVEERRGPGRPRGFDRSAALHAAMLVFWNYGFEGTSFTDLTEATGMSKPTLYATFGDKVSFFREAVVAYTALSAEAYEEALNRPAAREAVEACLRLARGLDPKPGEPIGCFVVQGALTGSADTQELRDELTAVRRQATQKLQTRLEQAKREGDLPQTVDVAVMAEYFSSLAVGLSVQAAGGSTPEQLNKVVTMAMAQWPGK
jgi:AcrR family transcriptional regulator